MLLPACPPGAVRRRRKPSSRVSTPSPIAQRPRSSQAGGAAVAAAARLRRLRGGGARRGMPGPARSSLIGPISTRHTPRAPPQGQPRRTPMPARGSPGGALRSSRRRPRHALRSCSGALASLPGSAPGGAGPGPLPVGTAAPIACSGGQRAATLMRATAARGQAGSAAWRGPCTPPPTRARVPVCAPTRRGLWRSRRSAVQPRPVPLVAPPPCAPDPRSGPAPGRRGHRRDSRGPWDSARLARCRSGPGLHSARGLGRDGSRGQWDTPFPSLCNEAAASRFPPSSQAWGALHHDAATPPALAPLSPSRSLHGE